MCVRVNSHIYIWCVNRFSLWMNDLRTHPNVLHWHTYLVLCKCFGVCTCMYCIPVMIIPSYKSILISCGCFPKLNFYFYLIGPLQKIMIFWYSPNISIFDQYGTRGCYSKRYPGMHILSHLIAWVQLLLLLLFLWVIFDNNFYYLSSRVDTFIIEH